MSRGYTGKERTTNLNINVPISVAQRIDHFADAADLSPSKVAQILIVRGLEAMQSDPKLIEMARRSEAAGRLHGLPLGERNPDVPHKRTE